MIAPANDVIDNATRNTSAHDQVQYDSTSTQTIESSSHAPANDVFDKATKNTSALDPVQYDSTKTVRNESTSHAPANDVIDKASKNTSAVHPVQYDRPPTPTAGNAHFDTDSDMDDGDPDNVVEDDVHMDSDTDKDSAVELVPASDDESDRSDIIPFQHLSRSINGSSAQKYQCIARSDSESDNELEYNKRISRDITYPEIYRTNNSRSRQICVFCKQFQTNLTQHIYSKKHESEPEVQSLKVLKHIERKLPLQLLRLKGNHYHNISVLDEKNGEIILSRRSNDKHFDLAQYGPCPNCYDWIKLSSLKRHQKKCPADREKLIQLSSCSLLIQSDMITGRLSSNASTALLEVFPIIQNDKLAKIAKNDGIIVSLGNQWMQRNIGNRIMRKYYTSSVMRLAAQLKVHLQLITHDKTASLEEFIHPKNFDHFVKAALKCAKQDDEDEEEIKSPSNAIKLGYDIKRMASAKLGEALKTGNEVKTSEAKDFLKLMTLNWGLQVTKLSRVVLSERNFNSYKPLPFPSDVKKLATYLQSSLNSLDLQDYSYTQRKKVAVLSLARLTLYNRRRCGEVQAIRYELPVYNKLLKIQCIALIGALEYDQRS